MKTISPKNDPTLREKFLRLDFPLAAGGIDDASEAITRQLTSMGVERKSVLRVRLFMEEALLQWRDAEVADTFTVEFQRRFRRANLTLRCTGRSVDPTASEDSEGLGRSMLQNLGLKPSWQYRNGENVLFTSQKTGNSPSQLVLVLLAAALALLLGALCKLLPAGAQDLLLNSLVTPVFDACLGLLSCIVGPMMFLSMVWGMFNIGDTRQLGRIGRKLLLRFLAVSTAVGAVCVGASLLAFDLNIGGGTGGGGVLKSIVEMFLDIIPANFVEPFLNGNTLQILFMGVVIGVVMILLRDRMQVMSQVVEQSNAIVQTILSAIGSMVPAFIFLSVLRLVLDGSLGRDIGSVAVLILVCVAITAADILVQVLSMLRLGVSPKKAFRKLSSHTFVGLSTASSAAAYPYTEKCCIERLGVDDKLTRFALPLGNVVFMPHVVNLMVIVPLAMASLYQVELSAGSLILCLINAVVLSVAAPPIPGGTLSCYTLMFLQLGVPLEALSLAIAANAILEFPVTAGDMVDLAVQMAHGAKALGMLDTEILKN